MILTLIFCSIKTSVTKNGLVSGKKLWLVETMKLITLYLPETYISYLDQLVEQKFFPNRAEAIRSAVRDMAVAFGKFTPLVTPKKTALERLDELDSIKKRHQIPNA